jgi:hypothetical protein
MHARKHVSHTLGDVPNQPIIDTSPHDGHIKSGALSTMLWAT